MWIENLLTKTWTECYSTWKQCRRHFQLLSPDLTDTFDQHWWHVAGIHQQWLTDSIMQMGGVCHVKQWRASEAFLDALWCSAAFISIFHYNVLQCIKLTELPASSGHKLSLTMRMSRRRGNYTNTDLSGWVRPPKAGQRCWLVNRHPSCWPR